MPTCRRFRSTSVFAWGLAVFASGVAGCGDGAQVTLPVRAVHYHAVPADGRRLPAPRGLTVGPDQEIYVLDNAGRVLVYNDRGQLDRQWRMPAYDVGKPEGVCVLNDGRVAVADTHYHRVVFFDRTGRVQDTLGKHGTGPGQFIYPVALTQDDTGNLYVAEYGSNDRVQKFSADQNYLLEFGGFGTKPGEFQRPSGIVWHQHRVYVADAINNRIQVFSDDGRFLKILCSTATGTALHYPYDLAKNTRGELFTVEYGAGRVTQIDSTGRLLGRFGSPGRGEAQLTTPWGLTVTANDRRVLVADTGNRRIVWLELD